MLTVPGVFFSYDLTSFLLFLYKSRPLTTYETLSRTRVYSISCHRPVGGKMTLMVTNGPREACLIALKDFDQAKPSTPEKAPRLPPIVADLLPLTLFISDRRGGLPSSALQSRGCLYSHGWHRGIRGRRPGDHGEWGAHTPCRLHRGSCDAVL